MAANQDKHQQIGSQRPTVYPYYSLQRAIDVASIVRDLGGMNEGVPKSLIAHRMELPEDSPTLMGVLGAAKLYCLIDGRGAYRLTETAKHFFYPTDETERKLAHLQMVKGPPLFSALIDRFDGTRLPPSDVLVNILHREHKISESWRTRAASLFVSSLREADVLDTGGFVRYKALLHGAKLSSAGAPPETQTDNDEPPANKTPSAGTGVKRESEVLPVDMDVWSFSMGGERVRLETSKELSVAVWEKLNGYIQVLKPEG